MPTPSYDEQIHKSRHELIDALSSAKRSITCKTFGERDWINKCVGLIDFDGFSHYVGFSLDDPSRVSFADKPENAWNASRRIKSTLGRYIRRRMKIGSDKISDETLAEFCFLVFGESVDLEKDMKIVYGQEVMEAYRRGVGKSSCMTGDDAELVELYVKNPDKVGMVIYGHDQGRALIWNTEEGERVLDRIYPNDGRHISVYHRWAMKNGVAIRVGQSLPDCGTVAIDGKRIVYTVKMDTSNVDKYPYLDTFHTGTFSDGEDSLLLTNSDSGEVTFDRTDGYTGEGQVCENCGDRTGDDGYFIFDENYCENCAYELYEHCSHCGEWCCRDDVTFLEDSEEYLCEYCCDNHAICCEDCGTWYSDRHGFTELVDVEEKVCEECVGNYSSCSDCGEFFKDFGNLHEVGLYNELYCDECAKQCEECGEWVQNENINSKNFCEDCYTNCEECGEPFPVSKLKDDLCDDCHKIAVAESVV